MEVRSVGRDDFFLGGSQLLLVSHFLRLGFRFAANDACSHALSFRFPNFCHMSIAK